ncbi:hypothetical protein WN944_010611 [Citrus x changshan-huyou]|uniref:Uncharacterized protein n=1 Tax=Citrus x changshan-huyou TaxID=2935761 RepID=A0AAP0R0S5_9ROSI
MDKNEILAKLNNQFPSLPQNALFTVYKARFERIRLVMRNNKPGDIRWLIEAKVRLAGMISDNREDKIQFIRDSLNKESLDDILLSLETHPNRYVQGAILQLWPLFQKERARYNLGNLTINDLGNRELSKLVSEATFIRGTQVLSIIPRAPQALGSLSDSPIGEELVVSGMQERITEMLADAFIFLLGDLATLEALITLASWAHMNMH